MRETTLREPTAYIFGAGVTGLSAGWKLSERGYRVLIYDKNPYLGGLATTFKHGDYLLDLGPHKLFTLMEDVMQEIRSLVGEDLLIVKKRSRIRLKGKYLNFPVGIKDLFMGLNPIIGMKCGCSYAAAVVRSLFNQPQDTSYEDWIVNRFGRAVFELIFSPYAKKIWGEPHTLSKELAETRIAIPSLFQMLKQMILGIKKDGVVMSADYFYYPKCGAVTLSQKMADKIKQHNGTIYLRQAVTKIYYSNNRFVSFDLDNGASVSLSDSDVVIGSIPLPMVVKFLSPDAPQHVMTAVSALQTRHLILMYIAVNRERLSEDNWIFFPGEEYIFNRAFEQKGFSPFMIPRDRTVVCLEITCDEQSPIWRESTEELYQKCVAQLEEAGLLKRSEVIEYFDIRLRNVYQIYDKDYKKNSRTVIDYLDTFENFYTIGRHGAFNYVGQADCLDMGFRTAEHILDHRGQPRTDMRKAFGSYTVID